MTTQVYVYRVRKDMGDKPVNFVGFWDACRFCNWLHNGKPTGGQNTTTTEDGAYDLTDSDKVTRDQVTRKDGARFFIFFTFGLEASGASYADTARGRAGFRIASP